MSEERQVTNDTMPMPGEARPTGPTPGTILAATREAMGLSIKDVAQVLRYSPRQIEALERDDYAALPGSTAVRGFIRSYSKLLKIDPVPLLVTLDPAIPPPTTDVRPPSNIGNAEHPETSKRLSPRMTVIGGVGVVALLIGFWFATTPSQNKQKVAALPVAVEALAPAAVSVTPPAPAIVASGGDAAPTVAAEAVPVTPALPGLLHVEFDDRSWIEVRDATQKVVFVGEYPAGTRQNIEGKAPFQLWIGKASAVRVFVGERSIDLRPHIREDVARLSVE